MQFEESIRLGRGNITSWIRVVVLKYYQMNTIQFLGDINITRKLCLFILSTKPNENSNYVHRVWHCLYLIDIKENIF